MAQIFKGTVFDKGNCKAGGSGQDGTCGKDEGVMKPKYVAVNGCDKCHLGYVYYICNRCDGMGCLYCRNEDFEIPEG